MDRIDADFVVYRLEEAGRTLIALPSHGCFPAQMKAAWPDVVHAAIEAYGWEGEMPRPAVPNSLAIDRMDEAWRWIAFIPSASRSHRRIVLMRSLVHPVTERHRWSWRRIGSTMGWDYRAVQRWHKQGIEMIVSELQRGQVSARNVRQKINAQMVA